MNFSIGQHIFSNMLRGYFFLCAVVLVKAQVPSLGFCPEYLPKADFDIDRFMGKWYEAERYFQFSELGSRCVVTDYAKGPSGKIYVSNEVTNRITGVKRVIDGSIRLSGKNGQGKMKVKYSTTPLSPETDLTVLDTDYDNYAVVWSCTGFGPIHAQSVWVMTRARIPPGPVMQEAYGILDKYKISRTFFLRTDQEGCAIAASDINAANGITAESTVAEATGSQQKINFPFFSQPKSQQREEPVRITSGQTVDILQEKETESTNIINNTEESTTEPESYEDRGTTLKQR